MRGMKKRKKKLFDLIDIDILTNKSYLIHYKTTIILSM